MRVANKDLRDWVDELDAAGQLETVTGADREEEIGGIVDIAMRKMTNPAVMFDDVPGYPKGHRVLANILTSVPRINLALGLPIDTPEVALVNRWRDYMRDQPVHTPVEVNGGPLNENVFEGDDIDITTIPSPRWHERDGGYYIGTACMVVMKDPDSGWINYGAYRIQAHDAKTASVMVSKGKHGNMIMNKYFDRGERCPIAVVAGMHPALFMVAGLGDAARRERVRLRRRAARRGRADHQHAEDRAAGAGQRRDRLRGVREPRTTWSTRGRSASGRATTRATCTRSPRSGSRPSCTATTRSCSAPSPACRPTTTRSTAAPIAAARCGTSSRPPACPEVKGCVGARGGRQPDVAHGIHQADVRRPLQAGRHDRLAVPRRRLRQPLGGGGRRRHRPGQHERRAVGDVHPLRPARGHRDDPGRLEHPSRPDVLQPPPNARVVDDAATPAWWSMPASPSPVATTSPRWCATAPSCSKPG